MHWHVWIADSECRQLISVHIYTPTRNLYQVRFLAKPQKKKKNHLISKLKISIMSITLTLMLKQFFCLLHQR